MGQNQCSFGFRMFHSYDSGKMTKGNVVSQTEDSKNKVKYNAAEGSKITNVGECNLSAESEEGIGLGLKAQVGDNLKRMLLAVSETASAGNAVMINVDKDLIRRLAREQEIHKNMIVNKRNLTKSRINEENGIYTYPMWIKTQVEEDKDANHAKTVQEDRDMNWMSGTFFRGRPDNRYK